MATAAILFAFNGVVSKILLGNGFDPLRLSEIRSTVAFLVIVAICALRGSWHVDKSIIPLLTAYGVSEFFVVPVAYFFAIRSLPLGVALLIEYLAPVFIALWLVLCHKSNNNAGAWVGLALSVLGLALVGQVWRKFGFSLPGIGAAFTAAVALAFSFAVGEATSVRLGSLNTMMWASGTGAVLSGIIRPWWSFRFTLFNGDAHGFPVWLLCLDIVVLGTIIPYLLLIEGLKRISASRVGVLMTLEPVTGVCIAWLLLGESLSPIQVFGAAIVLGGVITAEVARGARGVQLHTGQPATGILVDKADDAGTSTTQGETEELRHVRSWYPCSHWAATLRGCCRFDD